MDDPPVWLVIVVILAAVAGYCFAAYWIVTALFWPSLPYLLVGGAAIGVVIGVAVVVSTLCGMTGLAAPVVGPDQAADGRWFRPTRTAFPRDRAWPHYLAGQARSDLGTSWGNTTRLISSSWSRAVGPLRGTGWTLLLAPVLLFPLAVMGAASAGGALAALAALLICVGLLLAPMLVWVAALVVVRFLDRVVRHVLDARGGCPHTDCYEVTDLPGFQCACSELHRDIRPGVLGVLARRCRCGRTLPTTVLRAGARLTALCPRCDRPLRVGAGSVTDVRIPVVGPVSAGKTRFVHAAMLALQMHFVAGGARFDPADAASARAFTDGAELVRARALTSKTSPDRPPAAITARIAVGSRTALLHLFDPAGELLHEREQNRSLTFLDQAQGMVLIVDPFSVPAVAGALTGPLAARRASANPAHDDPESSYHVTAQRLRDCGVDLRRRSLAVALVKADLMVDLPPAAGLGPTSEQVRTWLSAQRMDNLVLAAERDFGEVRFFLVSSWTGWEPGDRHSAAAPLLWLADRVRLPLTAAVTS